MLRQTPPARGTLRLFATGLRETLWNWLLWSGISSGSGTVERLAQHRAQDNEAEAEWEIARWRHRSGVVIQRRYELEIAQQDGASCPECWIDWQVIDAAGQEINPMRKQFYNLCQQSFWLAMQAGGEDETSDRIAQITDNHP
ncbi:hypothetical protein LNP20_09385 [Klebsiella pneumoniae subsp. pneumoniae]|nr:hypothetical protein [Klebsiella pneumoniae subsp. pneumoniae]